MTHLAFPSPGGPLARCARAARAGAAFAASILLALAWAGSARAQVCTDTDCLPPLNSAYYGSSLQNYSWFGQPVEFVSAVHDRFTARDPAPRSRPPTLHNVRLVVPRLPTLWANPPPAV